MANQSPRRPMSKNKQGFTLVELLVVAPIVILVIGGFIGAIIAMTGSVLATRGANLLAYNIQDALNRIETDVRQSGAVLDTNNFDPTYPQGLNDGATKFTTGTSTLVLNTYATDKNPTDADRKIILKTDSAPLMMNTVYFVDNDGTLWRRIIAQTDYDTLGAEGVKPWQQPSCSVINTTNKYCTAKDIRLVDGVGASGFEVKLYNPSDPTNPITDLTGVSDVQVVITITATGSVAGREYTESGKIRAISPKNNTSS